MPDLLQTLRAELDARLDELRPFVTEYEQLLTSMPQDEPAPSPVETGPAQTSPCQARAREATRHVPIVTPRRRRAIRPAWPKAPRGASRQAA